MSLHHIANHLASKGRNGDTTLVHMTDGEVAGLQALAKANGKSLTKNPHTGLPEAFELERLLPMAAGAGMVAMGVPAPMAAGLVGLGAYASTGSLQQGLMAGLGAYGGAGLAGTAGLGPVAGASPLGGEAVASAIPEGSVVSTPITAPVLGTEQATNAFAPSNAAAADTIKYSGLPDVSTMTPQTGYVAPQGSPVNGLTETNVQAVGPVQSSFSAPVQATPSAAAPSMGETFMKNATANPWKTVGYGAAAMAPALMPEQKQYTQPEIKSDSDMGPRYAFQSGYDNSIPGRTGPASYKQISNEEAKKLYGFAEGGEIGYPGDPVVRMAEGGHAGYTGNVGDYSADDAAAARSGYGLGINYSGYDTPVNQGIAAVAPKIAAGANPNQNIVDLYAKVEAKRIADEKAAAEAEAAAKAAENVGGFRFYTPIDSNYAAGGGISTLGNYSDGGRLLKGPGDGMSDNIPAQIGAKQPARLADGEFVVPADVVSHLGNGSTDAGAKQLYKMMDKVRSARTGRKAQGKQINPNKLMPA